MYTPRIVGQMTHATIKNNSSQKVDLNLFMQHDIISAMVNSSGPEI